MKVDLLNLGWFIARIDADTYWDRSRFVMTGFGGDLEVERIENKRRVIEAATAIRLDSESAVRINRVDYHLNASVALYHGGEWLVHWFGQVADKHGSFLSDNARLKLKNNSEITAKLIRFAEVNLQVLRRQGVDTFYTGIAKELSKAQKGIDQIRAILPAAAHYIAS